MWQRLAIHVPRLLRESWRSQPRTKPNRKEQDTSLAHPLPCRGLWSGPDTSTQCHEMDLRRLFNTRSFRVCAVVVVLAVGLAGALASPYAVLEPGPTESVSRGTKGSGMVDSYEDGQGEFLMVTVNVRRASWLDFAVAHLPGSDAETARVDLTGAAKVASQESMDTSKQTAALVAEKFVTGDISHLVADGALVVGLVAESPAENAGLKAGDIIVEVGTTAVHDAGEVADAIEEHSGPVQVVIKRGPHRLAFDVTPRGRKIGVRIETHYHGTPVLTVETPGVGGASAGLAMTLAFIDALSPGDLTSAVVAATGTMNQDGSVGEIRGLRQKALGAKQAGATYMFAPRGDVEAGVRYALEIVPVDTVEDAVKYLCERGASDAVCEKKP